MNEIAFYEKEQPKCTHLRRASTIAVASSQQQDSSVRRHLTSWTMKATGRPSEIEASVSTSKGDSSQITPRLTLPSSTLRSLNDSNVLGQRGKFCAVNKDLIIFEKFTI